MRVTDETLGPGGRTLSTLLPSGERLPAHRFRSGDLVEVRAPGKKGNPSCNAILYRVRRDSLVLALEEDHELPAREGLRLDPLRFLLHLFPSFFST